MLTKIFPRALIVCIGLVVFSLPALAQNFDVRPKRIKQIEEFSEPASVEDEPVIISVAANASPGEEIKPNSSLVFKAAAPLARFQPQLIDAIDSRLGSPYHWGSTGPNAFDCSGFVWSSFHTAGIDFERGSARNLWARFEAPAPEEQFKFGTLVFFNRQHHVGIVVDEKGFYHASRHHGVVYAEFKGYWGKHIDGFRRVPVPVPTQTQRTDE
jgi:cell wall-associated NlpC family hydrolase